MLQTENDLQEIVQLVGRDSLSEDQKIVMDIARIIREDYLAQNAYTDYDYFCPFEKSVGMLNCIAKYYDLAIKALENSSEDDKLTWGSIKEQTLQEYEELTKMKFVNPKEMDPTQITAHFEHFETQILDAFRDLA